MGLGRVVVEQVLLQLIPQLGHRLESGSFQQVLIQGTPEPLHLAVGLGPVGSGVAMLDAQFCSIRSMG